MIISGTKVQVIDNSGALEGRCFKILSPVNNGHYAATVGDLILISVTKTIWGSASGAAPLSGATGSGSKLKKGDIRKAVIVRTKAPYRKDGIGGQIIKWDENAVVLASIGGKKKEYTPIGTRIKGPISGIGLRSKPGCEKILAIAKVAAI